MEETRNNSNNKPLILVVVLIVVVMIIVALVYYFHKGNTYTKSANQSYNSTASITPSPSLTTTTQLVQTNNSLTGTWTGRYIITGPQKCSGIAGSWTASIVENNNSFSGNYQSDYANGVVSGSPAGNNGFNWIVTGTGKTQLNGTITSANTVDGTVIGTLCPGTGVNTTGTFSGQKS